MRWQDDYLDHLDHPDHPDPTSHPGPERLRLQAYVDGRLVDSWTEPVRGSRWERFADQFDADRRPVSQQPPEPPREEQVLRWLDGVVGGRAALLSMTDEPGAPARVPTFADPDDAAAYAAVRDALERVAGDFLDGEARRALERGLSLLWHTAPEVVTGSRSPSAVAGGLLWVVGKANGLFDGGLTQALVRRELWLKQGLNVPGQAVARHLRGIDFHGARRPDGCPDLTPFACPTLLTAGTRRTLVQWRDLALALAEPAPPPSGVES